MSMGATCLGIALFVGGFFFGVYERKVDKVVFNKKRLRQTLTNETGPLGSAVLITPTPEEQEKQETKEFYEQMR